MLICFNICYLTSQHLLLKEPRQSLDFTKLKVLLVVATDLCQRTNLFSQSTRSFLFTQATRLFLSHLNNIRENYGVTPVSWKLAVRFLMARKFDVKRALELFRNHTVYICLFHPRWHVLCCPINMLENAKWLYFNCAPIFYQYTNFVPTSAQVYF